MFSVVLVSGHLWVSVRLFVRYINAVTLEPFELRYRHEIFTGAKAPLMAKMAAACSVGGGLTL